MFDIKIASEPWEMRGARALRHTVFCEEQRLFTDDDTDASDEIATTLVAIETMMGMPHRVIGTVRVHAGEAGLWFGSRLAIEREYREAHGIGTRLVRRAVAFALGYGCSEFRAHVQQKNVAFFAGLAWTPIAFLTLHGTAHTTMRADLRAS